MVRLRKEKGGSSRSAPASKPVLSKNLRNTKPADTVLREQVLALGGTQDDIDLLKNVDENTTGSPSKHDVCASAFPNLNQSDHFL
jgi:ribosome biogenesis protein MAK21